MHREEVVAIVPAHLLPNEALRKPGEAAAPLNGWFRVALLGVAAGLLAVFGIAARLDPYDRDGTPLRMEAHRQLGFPRCTFYDLTGKPCPSCGLTTSFALLMHGDVVNSLRANAVGTLLALFCLAAIPWNLACAVRGRLYIIRSLELSLTCFLAVFLALLLLRWGIVLALS